MGGADTHQLQCHRQISLLFLQMSLHPVLCKMWLFCFSFDLWITMNSFNEFLLFLLSRLNLISGP